MGHRITTGAALALALGVAPAATAEEWVEPREVILFLETVQALSLRTGREYCGYFVLNEGEVIALPPKRGRLYECLADEPPLDVEIVASYHSHGAFDPGADSEVPSVDDILGDREEVVDGYLVTPGGRIWFHDLESGRIEQVCGPACVTPDPDHDDALFDPIAESYTLNELKERFSIRD